MSLQTTEIINRLDFITKKGHEALAKQISNDMGENYVPGGSYAGFRSSGLSFISSFLGPTNNYFKEFDRQVDNTNVSKIESGISILNSIRDEVEHGWLITFKQLVAAELFSDFLEMSQYFLDNGYKDPAAVMIGSVLEEHLRQLCLLNFVDITIQKGPDTAPKKAHVLSADLVKAGVYGPLEQKSVTYWLGIRNSAAHGKYSDYTTEQVSMMLQGVIDFISRIK